MSYRKYLMTDDVPPSELYKAVELSTNLAEVGTDCISRQSAIDALRKLREEDIEDYGCEIPEGFNQDHLDRATFAINQLPSAQPDIIHCRECKNCQIDSVFHDYWCDGRKVWKDHYCGYAERRTDEE